MTLKPNANYLCGQRSHIVEIYIEFLAKAIRYAILNVHSFNLFIIILKCFLDKQDITQRAFSLLIISWRRNAVTNMFVDEK